MAQVEEAKRFRADFEQALIDYGQTVIRTRSARFDNAGNQRGSRVGRLRCITLLQIETVPRMAHSGLDNIYEALDGDALYFGGLADIAEDDELTMNGMVHTVSLCRPFVMADIILFWQVNYLRIRRA